MLTTKHLKSILTSQTNFLGKIINNCLENPSIAEQHCMRLGVFACILHMGVLVTISNSPGVVTPGFNKSVYAEPMCRLGLMNI